MAAKSRRTDAPDKAVTAIAPHRIRPTRSSSPPMRQPAATSKRGRGRPSLKQKQKSKQKSSKTAGPAVSAKRIAKPASAKRTTTTTTVTKPRAAATAAADTDVYYTARRILDETRREYLIEWDCIDPRTLEPWPPSWQPKAYANRALAAEWRRQKAGREWAAHGIVHERGHYYKIAWEDDPATGEVYPDTWEPKPFAGAAMVREWELRKAELLERGATPYDDSDGAAASEDESAASDGAERGGGEDADSAVDANARRDAEGEVGADDADDDDNDDESDGGSDDEGSSEDAMQRQILREIQASPSRRNRNGP